MRGTWATRTSSASVSTGESASKLTPVRVVRLSVPITEGERPLCAGGYLRGSAGLSQVADDPLVEDGRQVQDRADLEAGVGADDDLALADHRECRRAEDQLVALSLKDPLHRDPAPSVSAHGSVHDGHAGNVRDSVEDGGKRRRADVVIADQVAGCDERLLVWRILASEMIVEVSQHGRFRRRQPGEDCRNGTALCFAATARDLPAFAGRHELSVNAGLQNGRAPGSGGTAERDRERALSQQALAPA